MDACMYYWRMNAKGKTPSDGEQLFFEWNGE
jgi:hypothetical protein